MDAQPEAHVKVLSVRCPNCYEGYSVELGDIQNQSPQFECVSCRARFMVPCTANMNLNEVFLGKFISAPEKITVPEKIAASEQIAVSPKSQSKEHLCPKCSAPYAAGQAECKQCGVVFFKLATQQQDSQQMATHFSASKEVRQMWEDVIHNYENYEAHQNFVSAAWADQSLDYAAAKYADILKVAPQDDIATKAQREIQALALVRFESVMGDPQMDFIEKPQIAPSLFAKMPVTFRRLKFTNLIMFGCGVLIVMGMLLPHLRNLIGFGASILFFVLALRFLL